MVACVLLLWRQRNDGVAQREGRREDAVIRDQLDDRRGDQSRKPFQQRERFEHNMRRSFPPRLLELHEHFAAVRQRQALMHDGWTRGMTTEPLESVAAARIHPHSRVQ
jgi:hypothetical protein